MRVSKFSRTRKNPEKQYRKSNHAGRECRNHGKCPECRENRTHFDMKHRVAAEMELREFLGR